MSKGARAGSALVKRTSRAHSVTAFDCAWSNFNRHIESHQEGTSPPGRRLTEENHQRHALPLSLAVICHNTTPTAFEMVISLRTRSRNDRAFFCVPEIEAFPGDAIHGTRMTLTHQQPAPLHQLAWTPLMSLVCALLWKTSAMRTPDVLKKGRFCTQKWRVIALFWRNGMPFGISITL